MHGADVCTLLKGDHEKVRDLIERLERTEDVEEKRRLFQAVRHEVELHKRLEEEVFFPALSEGMTGKEREDIIHRAREQQRRTLHTVEMLETAPPPSRRFQDTLETLKSRIDRHAQIEEEHVFRKVRERMDTEHMQKIADLVNQRRLELEDLYKGRARTAREASES